MKKFVQKHAGLIIGVTGGVATVIILSTDNEIIEGVTIALSIGLSSILGFNDGMRTAREVYRRHA